MPKDTHEEKPRKTLEELIEAGTVSPNEIQSGSVRRKYRHRSDR